MKRFLLLCALAGHLLARREARFRHDLALAGRDAARTRRERDGLVGVVNVLSQGIAQVARERDEAREVAAQVMAQVALPTAQDLLHEDPILPNEPPFAPPPRRSESRPGTEGGSWWTQNLGTLGAGERERPGWKLNDLLAGQPGVDLAAPEPDEPRDLH